jgi:hypothetical protein
MNRSKQGSSYQSNRSVPHVPLWRECRVATGEDAIASSRKCSWQSRSPGLQTRFLLSDRRRPVSSCKERFQTVPFHMSLFGEGVAKRRGRMSLRVHASVRGNLSLLFFVVRVFRPASLCHTGEGRYPVVRNGFKPFRSICPSLEGVSRSDGGGCHCDTVSPPA